MHGTFPWKRCLPLIFLILIVGGCRQGEPLPNGYAVFFASSTEASLVKPATKGGECLAGPHVAELGHSGKHIFGRIAPMKGAPRHPDQAPGYFLIDSTSDKVTTGLAREDWLAELRAVGIESPKLLPPERKWPRTY